MNFGSPSNVTGSVMQKLCIQSPQSVAKLRNIAMQHPTEVTPNTCVVCAPVFLVVSDYYVAYVVTPLNTNHVSYWWEIFTFFERKTVFIQIWNHNIFQWSRTFYFKVCITIMFLAPPAERQRSFSNTDLSVVRLSVCPSVRLSVRPSRLRGGGGGVYLRNASVTFLLFWHEASFGRHKSHIER